MIQSPHSTQQWVLLARILKPQGRKGEVLADLFTDFPDRFTDRPEVWLAPAGSAEGADAGVTRGQAPKAATVRSHWLPVGRNAGRVVLHFAGVDSITEAEKLAGKEVVLPLTERIALSDGSVYLSDLIGCTVLDGDTALGVVDSVDFPTTPDGSRRLDDGTPLLVVRTANGAGILIPFAKSYIVAIDTAVKTIRMSLPKGLVDLNAEMDRNSGEDQ